MFKEIEWPPPFVILHDGRTIKHELLEMWSVTVSVKTQIDERTVLLVGARMVRGWPFPCAGYEYFTRREGSATRGRSGAHRDVKIVSVTVNENITWRNAQRVRKGCGEFLREN